MMPGKDGELSYKQTHCARCGASWRDVKLYNCDCDRMYCRDELCSDCLERNRG